MSWIARIFLNLAILAVTALPILILTIWVAPAHRGFFCNDESLAYPYHSSTVHSWMLYVGGFGVPMLTILVCEAINAPKIGTYFQSLIPVLISFLFGAAMSQLVTDICKYTIGRLRPHFFDVCQPTYNATECSFSLSTYVTNYSCPGNTNLFDPIELQSRLKEIHLSFPSGHASFSFQAATYTVIYLQFMIMKNKWPRNSLVVPFVQTLVVCLAVFTAASRVMDNKHHPTDVLAGVVIGVLAQILNTVISANILNAASGVGIISLEEDNRELERIRTDVESTDYNSIPRANI